mmetsp:Transcript_7284/g.32836  ORF Transcript_7284/g.32836 Transcript_7284/m.32836 type:complete len:229 (+) Transcript_7284:1093-1779(+)
MNLSKSVTNQSAPSITASRCCTPPYPTKTSAPPGALDSRSVAPSPTIAIVPCPNFALMCFTASALPPALLVNSVGSKDSYSPASSNRMLLAKMFSFGTPSRSATGAIICRKPPETRYTVLPLALRASKSSATPGEIFGSLLARYVSTVCLVGCITRSRDSRASRNETLPPIALLVISATSSPLPRKAASSSMPSSVHTVLSTSKHTPVAVRRRSMTSSEGSLLEVDGI